MKITAIETWLTQVPFDMGAQPTSFGGIGWQALSTLWYPPRPLGEGMAAGTPLRFRPAWPLLTYPVLYLLKTNIVTISTTKTFAKFFRRVRTAPLWVIRWFLTRDPFRAVITRFLTH